MKLKEAKIEKTGEYVIKKMSMVRSEEINIILPDLRKKTKFKLANIDKEHLKIFSIFNFKIENNQIKHT